VLLSSLDAQMSLMTDDGRRSVLLPWLSLPSLDAWLPACL